MLTRSVRVVWRVITEEGVSKNTAKEVHGVKCCPKVPRGSVQMSCFHHLEKLA